MVHISLGNIRGLFCLVGQAPVLGQMMVGHDAPNFRPNAIKKEPETGAPMDQNETDRDKAAEDIRENLRWFGKWTVSKGARISYPPHDKQSPQPEKE